jgi:hypothetical protein
MRRISLTESQFLHIASAAKALALADQPAFFDAVANALRDVPVGDGSVFRAIRIAQLQFPHPETAHTSKSRRQV